MTTKPRKIVAALAATLAASTALVAAGGVTTGASAAKQQRVNLAFTARSFGASVYTNGIAVKPVRLANSELGCTKTVNKKTSSAALTPPAIGDLIRVEGVKSDNNTYRYKNGQTGVRAVNRIARVEIGPDGGPGLVLRGLKSVSNAYKKGGRFQTTGAFTFEGIRPVGLEGGGPLGDLLDLISGGVGQVLQQLNAGETITIPGVATLSIASSRQNVTQGTRGSAERQTNGLRIKLIPQNLASVNLGNTRARVSQPVPAGVFQGGTAAVQGALIDDLAGIGATNATLIPCEGTFGKKVKRNRASGGLVSPVVIDVTDARSTIQGRQSGKTGSAFTQVNVGRVNILPEQLADFLPVVRVDNLAARVNVSGNPSKGKVKRTFTSKVGALYVRGERVPLPGVGKSRSYDEGSVVVTRQVKKTTKAGHKVTALRVKYLPNLVNAGIDPVTLDLGNSNLLFYRG